MAAPRRFFMGLGASVDLPALVRLDDRPLQDRLRRASDLAVARAIPTVQAEEAARVLSLLPAERATAVFRRLATSERALLLPRVADPLRTRLFRALPRDEQADVIPELDEPVRDALLGKLPPEERRELKQLLKYPEDYLASIMTVGVPTFLDAWTAAEAIDHLRRYANDERVSLHYVYVVDEKEHLVGVLSIRDLVNLRPDRLIGEAASRDVTTLSLHQDPEEAARAQQASRWRSLPVVDLDGRLAGVLTDEAAAAFLALEETEDFQRFGGMQPVESPYLRTSVFTFFKKRAGWLLVLFLAEFITAGVLRHYEVALENQVALAFFVPLLLATGGNTGSQSTSLLVRALAVGEIGARSIWRVAAKEGLTGLLLGVFIGAVAFARAETWGGPLALSLVVALSVVVVCVLAAVAGGLLPLLVHRLGYDPAFMSAPLISTIVDAAGVLIYMSLAVAVLAL